MKRILGTLLIAAATLLCAVPVIARSPKQSDEQRLARLDREIADLTLRMNHKTWGCYIDFAERTRRTIPINNFKQADLQALLDTVPELKAAQERYKEASDRVKELLKTDPEYESIHREYISLKGIKDKAKNDANIQRYNLLYSRMRATCPDYPAANTARQEAYRDRNAALTRYLFNYYQQQGRAMPMQDVISGYRSEINAVHNECPEIVKMDDELIILRRLRRELQEQLLRKEFGVEKPNEDKSDKIIVEGMR